MQAKPYILFCEDPFEAGKVDPDFEDEFRSAKDEGFSVGFFNFDVLTGENNVAAATKSISPAEVLSDAIYRGWMLTPVQYTALYENLLAKNYKLINAPVEYQNCHYLPDSLPFIEKQTPRTVFEKLNDEGSLERLIEKVSVFGNGPVIIKDFVKSEKHDWETACFVPDVSDTAQLKQTIANFLRLRDKYLNEGIVVREFLELNDLAIHSKSGMPLTEEYRLFFFKNHLVGIYDYWEEGEYVPGKPETKAFEEIARTIESHFFSMDIARQKNGTLVIIELGDGQVAGLPDKLDRDIFYKRLASIA